MIILAKGFSPLFISEDVNDCLPPLFSIVEAYKKSFLTIYSLFFMVSSASDLLYMVTPCLKCVKLLANIKINEQQKKKKYYKII